MIFKASKVSYNLTRFIPALVPYRLFSCFFRQLFSTVKTRKCSDKSTYLQAEGRDWVARFIPALVLMAALFCPGSLRAESSGAPEKLIRLDEITVTATNVV